MNNLYHLIGHPGTGKTTYSKKIEKKILYYMNKNEYKYKEIVIYDEDDLVLNYSECKTFDEMIEKGFNIQDTYEIIYNDVVSESIYNEEVLFVIATGGLSALYKKEYYTGNSIYIRSEMEDLLDENLRRIETNHVIMYLSSITEKIKDFLTDLKDENEKHYKEFIDEANDIYSDISSFFIENVRNDDKKMNYNVELIIEYINLDKEY